MSAVVHVARRSHTLLHPPSSTRDAVLHTFRSIHGCIFHAHARVGRSYYFLGRKVSGLNAQRKNPRKVRLVTDIVTLLLHMSLTRSHAHCFSRLNSLLFGSVCSPRISWTPISSCTLDSKMLCYTHTRTHTIMTSATRACHGSFGLLTLEAHLFVC